MKVKNPKVILPNPFDINQYIFYNSFIKQYESVSMEAGEKGASPEAVAKIIFKQLITRL